MLLPVGVAGALDEEQAVLAMVSVPLGRALGGGGHVRVDGAEEAGGVAHCDRKITTIPRSRQTTEY